MVLYHFGTVLGGPIVGHDGRVYATSVNGDAYAVSTVGAQLWKANTGGQARGPMTMGTDGTLYAGRNGGGQLSSLIMLRQTPAAVSGKMQFKNLVVAPPTSVDVVLRLRDSNDPATVLTFDSLPAMGSIAGQTIPNNAKLSDLYLNSNGIKFYSSAPYVAVVNQNNQTNTTPNGLGGATAAGILSYSRANPIVMEFFDPGNTTTPAATSFFSLDCDRDGRSSQTVTINAYDVDGNLVGTDSKADVGGQVLTISLSSPKIHKVVFLGAPGDSDGVGIDDVTFKPVYPNSQTVATGIATVGSDGKFTCDINMPFFQSGAGASGKFDFSVKPLSYLRKTVPIDVRTGAATKVNLTLINGDVDDNNIVQNADKDAVNAALNSHAGDANWNPRADLNGDGVVDKLDRAIVFANLGKIGDN